MAAPRRAPIVSLRAILARRGVANAPAVIVAGRVLVDGRVLSNPDARVRADAAIRVLPARRLKGDVKLSHALDLLDVPVAGRVALDVGASAGGFTTSLLRHGARRVYAVDAGVGQLRGELRTDPRVVNLEGQNLADLEATSVDDAIGLVTVDLSYLALADALPQLSRIRLDVGAHMVALVKPTFELHRGSLAATTSDLEDAIELVIEAMEEAGWTPCGRCDAPATGRRGAREAFLLGRA
jgi:23S rRNA (cytidine1920-2'-O)/16S rRNA (cytidine1409-2'-O)-methyltransferase